MAIWGPCGGGGGLFQPGNFLTVRVQLCAAERESDVFAFGQPVRSLAIQGQSLCFWKSLSTEAINQPDLLSFCKQQITQENVITHSLCY